MAAKHYDRDTLYEEVWAEPLIDVAERYGVSDVALGKTCRKLAVPLPGRGYWAKVKAGQNPKKTKLPPLPDGVPPGPRHLRLCPTQPAKAARLRGCREGGGGEGAGGQGPGS